MTYKESYKDYSTISELKVAALADIKVAYFMGGNPDRLKAIEDAMNERAKEINLELKEETT